MPASNPSTPETPFCLPIRRLQNACLILEPFSLSAHAEPYVLGTKHDPSIFHYTSYGPFSTVAEYAAFYNSRIAPSDAETFFAILAKSNTADEKGVFTGVIGLQNASLANASVEIGYITILPAFQRTFVTSNAVGLLLQYTLDPLPDGLGLRRCQWQTHAENEASRRVATRMGFTFECVQRFQRIVPLNKVGNGFDTSGMPDVLGRNLGPSRDSAVFAHYCDEWPEKRKGVVAVMERR